MIDSQACYAPQRKSVLSLVPPMVANGHDHTPPVVVPDNLTLSAARGWCRVAFALVGASVELPVPSKQRRKAARVGQMDLFGETAPDEPVTRTQRRSMDGPLKLLMVLRGFCRREEEHVWSHASLATLAERTGRCRRTVWSYLRILEAAGLIELQVTGKDAAGRTKHGGGWRRAGVGEATRYRLTALAWTNFPTGVTPAKRTKKRANSASREKATVQRLHPTSPSSLNKGLPPTPNPTPERVIYMNSKTKDEPAETDPKGYQWHDDRIREDLTKRGYAAEVVTAALEELGKRPDVVARRNWAEAVARRKVNEAERDSRERVRAKMLRDQVTQVQQQAASPSPYGGESGAAYERECLERQKARKPLQPWERIAAKRAESADQTTTEAQ